MNIKGIIRRVSALAVASMLILSYMPYGSVSAKTLSELRAERNKLQSETEKARKNLADVKQKQADLEAEIKAMDGVINAANAEYEQAKADLEDVTRRLEESEAALAEAEKNKEAHIELLKERLVFLHENGDIGYIEAILNSESFSDMLLKLQYVQDIIDYDENMIDELTKIEETIQEETENIRLEKAEAEELYKLADQKKRELDSILEQKKNLMATYEQNEANYEKIIESNMKASAEAERLINELTSQSDNSTYTYTGGQLNWPVPSRSASSSSLSSGFVYRKRPIGSGYEYHSGYDIPAAYGANIVAAEDGTVIYSGWMRGYGNTIMINHGGGIVTLYGHNSSLVVSKGATVTRGQTVAKCGSTGNSTGNHCHFEVRVNGKPVSPEPYLGVKNISS